MRKQLCNKDHSENRACHDLSKINRNTEFIPGRMRILSYACFSCYTLFFNQFTLYKVHQRFENQNLPFRERTNYTLDIKEQNYATYQYKRCNVATRFWRQTDVGAKRTEFDYYCLHPYAFSEKTSRVTKDFNVIYL